MAVDEIDNAAKNDILKGAHAVLSSPSVRGFTPQQKSEELKNWLESQDAVEKVSVFGDTDVTVKFKDKTHVGIMLNRDKFYGGGPGDTTDDQTSRSQSFELSEGIRPESLKAAVIDTLGDDWPGTSTPDGIRNQLVMAGYNVDYIRNNDANLQFFAEFDDREYGIAFIRTHGGILNVDGDDKLHIMVRPFFENLPPDSGYAGVGAIMVFTNVLEQEYGYVYAFNDLFVQKYLNNKRFPNSLFHLLVCHGANPLAQDDMVRSFLDRGVGCYTGWTKKSSGDHGDPAALRFFKAMCDLSEPANTVKIAIDQISSAGQSPDPKTGAVLVAHGSDSMQIVDSSGGDR